jgi:hypothetical protein
MKINATTAIPLPISTRYIIQSHQLYIKPPNDVLRKVQEEKVIQIENGVKAKAVKEEKMGVTDF